MTRFVFKSLVHYYALIFPLLLVSSISNAATYYVSPNGSDANPGSRSRPFATISKAAELLLADDTCVIRSGTYRETVVPANSGTDGKPITFVSAPRSVVIVSGSNAVSNWQHYKAQIYDASVGKLEGDAQAYIWDSAGYHALIEARWPAIPSYNIQSIHNSMAIAQSGSNTTIADTNLTQADGFWNGATVWCRGGVGWLPQTSTVRNYSAETHTITFDPFGAGSILDPMAGSDYYLTDCLNALQSPGEYYYDKPTGLLYLWAPDGGIPYNVEVKARSTAFNLDGRSYIRIGGLNILAANVTMVRSDHCELRAITDKFVAYANTSQTYLPTNQMQTGIAIDGSNNLVRDSEIAYSTGCLLSVTGQNNRIINNNIHDGDYIGTYAPLVYLVSGNRNLVSNNTLDNAGRYGIFIGTGNSCIQYNDISNYMWLSSDGGGIYCWGVDLQNTEIHHNIVHDSRDYSAGNGIYLDNFDENAIVHHNVIYNVDHNGITLNTPSSYELIYNNTVDSCTQCIGHWGESPYQDDLFPTEFVITSSLPMLTYHHRALMTVTSNVLRPTLPIQLREFIR